MKYIKLLLLFIIITSCTDEQISDSSIPRPVPVDGKIDLILDLKVGGYHQPATKNSESSFDTPWILSFKITASSDTIFEEAVKTERAPSGYYVQLTSSSEPHLLLVIANADRVIETNKNLFQNQKYWKVARALSYGNPLNDGIGQLPDPLTSIPFSNMPIPMSATINLDRIDTNTQLNGSINLQRIVSKVYVNAQKANATNNFTLTGITVLKVPAIGYLDNKISSASVEPQSLVDYGKKEGDLISDLIIKDIRENTTVSDLIDRPIYVYPFLTDSKTMGEFFLILQGDFGGETKYFKIKLGGKDYAGQLISPNTSIIVNIESIATSGYASLEQAIRYEPCTGVVVKVVMLDNSFEVIADQSFYLGVSNSKYKLYAAGTQTNKEVVTVTTNAFDAGNTAPSTSIELIDAENMLLSPGQQINSNSTSIKVDFLDLKKAKGTLRVRIGRLVKDIVIEKDITHGSNYESGNNGFLIADNILTAYIINNISLNIENAAGLAFSINSNDRALEVETTTPSNLYLFFQRKTGRQDLYIRSQNVSGAIQLTELKEEIPAFAGSNIYWDNYNKKLTFDNIPAFDKTALNEENQGVRFIYGSIVPLGTKINGSFSDVKILFNPTGLDLNQAALPMPIVVENSEDALKQFSTTDNYDNGIGDICRYMTARGWAPQGSKWKLPTTNDFKTIIKILNNSNPPHGTTINLIDTYNGDNKISHGLRLNNLFFPYNGYIGIVNGADKIGTNLEYRTASGTSIFNINESTDMLILRREVPNYSAGVRCVPDDSKETIERIGILEYDVNIADAGQITDKLASKHFKIGASIKLSDKQLTSLNGKIHTGWRIDNKFYPLGSYLTNLRKDIQAIAVWSFVAGSNIYWDGTKLTFDDIPSIDGTRSPNEHKQGVLFKFGSLIAIGSSYHDDIWDKLNVFSINSQILDPTAENLKWANNIPFEDVDSIKIDRNVISGKRPYLSHPPIYDPSLKRGDICKFITEKGWAPGSAQGVRWRMPTYDEMRNQVFVFQGNNWSPLILPINTLMYTGNYEINTGVYSPSTNTFVTASGSRKDGVMQLPQNYGDYWLNSTEQGGARAFYFRKDNGRILFNLTLNKDAALGVRCIRDISY